LITVVRVDSLLSDYRFMRFVPLVTLVLFFLKCFGLAENDSSYVYQRLKWINQQPNATIRIIEYKKLIPIAKSQQFKDEWIKTHLEYPIGQNYSRIGDFKRAQESSLFFREYYLTRNDFENLYWTYNDFGIYQFNERNYEASIESFYQALSVSTKYSLKDYFIDSYQGLADGYMALGDIDSAEFFINKINKILAISSNVHWESELYAYCTNGHYSYLTNELKKAENYYNKALQIADKETHRKGADIRNRLATIYLEQNEPKNAINILNESIAWFNEQDSGVVYDAYLMRAYSSLTDAFYQLGELDSALHYTNKAQEQYGFFIYQYAFDESKIAHSELRRKNIELAVKTGIQLYDRTKNNAYLRTALLYANSAKANLLNERRTKSYLITDEIKAIRNKWIYKLTRLKKESNQGEIIKIRNQLDSLDQSLGIKKEREFSSKELTTLQNSLNPYQLVLQYFLVDNMLYSFTISNNKIGLERELLDVDGAKQYYNMLRNPASSYTKYLAVGTSLYNTLLHSILQRNPQTNEILIIPDKVLNYVPFESLPTKRSSNWSTTQYVGSEFNIGYEFSLQGLLKKDYNGTRTYAGFAPVFEQSSVLSDIHGNVEFVSQRKSDFGGKAFIKSSASTANLRDQAFDYQLLHLYTHAISNDSSFDASYIHLQNRKMYVDEILALPLENKLCVLTACEVAMGKEYNGEGITGVAWAFRAAGAQNTIQSLWSINQETSKTLNSLFFEKLKEGQSSKQALQAAKNSYLKNETIF
jgi:tetratricopeptide (TPR) repeat protein